MKHIKEYNEYKDIDAICQRYGITNYTINNGLVDVDASVDLASRKLTKLPLQFGKVTGNFFCDSNQLTSLEGAPKTVEGNFYCHNNQLTSLEYAPKTVEGNFYCHNNKLTSLEGAPEKLSGNFYCNNNQLTTLEGGPKTVEGNFNCGNNKLTSLEYAPEKLSGKFYCENNPLPKEIYTYNKYIKEIIKWQGDYNIWRNGKLDPFRFGELIKDILENEVY